LLNLSLYNVYAKWRLDQTLTIVRIEPGNLSINCT
jgi:hypothetical protein